jgi:translation initiation factor 2 beta subunit (eIF-2beta)/eIF-5
MAERAELNMDGSADPFYRYKMHELQLTQQGRRHVLSNLDKISLDVGRSKSLLISFFDHEVFRPSGMPPCIVHENGEIVAPKGVDQPLLQAKLFEFIRDAILCPCCRNPETNIASVQGCNIELECAACGSTTLGTKMFSASFSEWMRNPEHRKHLETVKKKSPIPPIPQPDDWDFPSDGTTPSQEVWD